MDPNNNIPKYSRTLYKDNLQFSKNIRLLRILSEKQQQEVAQCLHMSRSAYFQLENGTCFPNYEIFFKVPEIYSVSPDSLISFDISHQILSMLKHSIKRNDAVAFLNKYLQLSHETRKIVNKEIKRRLTVETGGKNGSIL